MRNTTVYILVLAILGLLASCSGEGMHLTAAGRDSEIGLEQSGTRSLPTIPADVRGTVTRGASALTVIEGADAQEFSGGTVMDTDMQLLSTETDLGWALYKFEGLAGKRATQLSVAVLPGAEGSGGDYMVGVGNYSDGVWDWQQPGTADGFVFDLTLEQSRLVSQLGNFYFVVVVSGGNSITVESASLSSEDETPDNLTLPARVRRPSVSEGLVDGILVNWTAASGADQYELWRRQDDPDGPWELIATQVELSYMDTAVELSQEYKYRVRGENFAGFGSYSEPRSGFAGDPPVGFDDALDEDIKLVGQVTELTETSITLGGITVAINEWTLVLVNDAPADLTAIEVGMLVEVEADANGQGGWTATIIEPEDSGHGGELRVDALIETLGDMTLSAGGYEFGVNSETEIRLLDGDGGFSDLQTGMFVEVRADPNGEDAWMANRITVLAPAE